MRGKADVVLNRIDRIGITPAYAGKRVIRSSFHKLFQDHPGLCGEKQHFFYFLVYTGGSPPPMRGKVLQSKKNHATGGITPAYAGKSCNRFRTSGSGGDHPRLCGEKPASSSLVMFQPGSPPPMRGKALQFFEKQQDRRITPAYAGKRLFRHPFSSLKRDHPRLCGEK